MAPAVFAPTQKRIVRTIQPIGCAIHCEYSVYRMIFSPRVAPMKMNASAAKDRRRGRAERRLGDLGEGGEALREPPGRRKATAANGNDTATAIATERWTSPGARATSPRPEDRHETHVRDVHPETGRGRGDEANCVVSVTTPNA